MARGSSRLKVMLGMVVLSILLVAVCKWQIIVEFQRLEEVNDRQMELEAMSNSTLYHHEAMTSAAQMYTLSNLPRWLSQYKSAKQKLGQDLINIRLHSPETFESMNVDLQAASGKLQQIEDASFRLLQTDARLQGLDLLGGPDYMAAKEMFSDKLMLLKQALDEVDNRNEAMLHNGLMWRFITLGIVLLMLFVMWAVCLYQMMRWERRMQEADSQMDEAEYRFQMQGRVLDNIINNLPVGLFAKDVQNDYRYSICNKKADELFEIPTGALLGTTDFEHFLPHEATFFRQTDEKVVREGRVVEVDVEDVTSARGTWLAHTIKVPIYDDAGKPSLLVGIFEDITVKTQQANTLLQSQSAELEAKNRELEAAVVRAEAADKAKAEFLETMSKELEAPLLAIADAADQLLKAELGGRSGGHVRTIRKCAGLLLFTLNDMAELAEDEITAKPLTDKLTATALADISMEKRARLQASFRDSATACLGELEQAALFGDAERFRRAAHQLKGAAATFGYTKLQDLAGKAEHEQEAHRERVVTEIRAEFARICDVEDGMARGHERMVPPAGIEPASRT